MSVLYPDRKIKILHVLDSLAIGGMERVVIDVVNGLDPLRFDQTVCCLSRKGESARHLRDGVVCIDLGKGDKADYLMPVKIARVLREQQPDIVHTQSWSGIDTAIAKLIVRRGRLVHSEHGRNLPHILFEPLKRKIARRALFHLADAVFAISTEVRDYYCRETGFPAGRMLVIPNGIDLHRIDGADSEGVRHELGIEAGDFVIGTVARLDRTKDTITLARAFAMFYHKEQSTDARLGLKLLVVGEGDQKAALEKFVVEQGLKPAVIFTGLRHDVPRLLGAMDIFALSSLSEGMPITVLEAMCASLPVVATRVGALPELIEEGGSGWLAEPGQVQQMAEMFETLYRNPELARQFGRTARRKVEREYAIDRMLHRYEELYLRCAKRN